LAPWLKDLTDKAPPIRAKAALVLGSLGPKAERALPALTRALQDEDAQVRLGAAMAIAHIQRKKSEQVVTLQRVMREVRDRIEAINQFRGGPRNPGLYSPDVQAQLHQFVRLYILAKGSAWGQALLQASGVRKQSLDQALGGLGPEAVPALVEGVNFVAAHTVGDC
jgi:HEAT repeat protein